MDRFDIEGEEVIDGEAKPFGNGAHVTVPKEWRGASVKVVRTGEPWTPADGLDLEVVAESRFDDHYRGWVRLPESRIEALDLEPGDVVQLSAPGADEEVARRGTAAAVAWRADRNDPESAVRVPPLVRLTLGAAVGDEATVRPAAAREAHEVTVAPVAAAPGDGPAEAVGGESGPADERPPGVGDAVDELLDADGVGDELLDAAGAEDVTPASLGTYLLGRPLVVGQFLAVPADRGVLERVVRRDRRWYPFRVVETSPDGVVTVGPDTSVRLAD
jgi:putative transposon-encoded protein